MNVVVRETEPPCKATDLELLGLVEVYSPALMPVSYTHLTLPTTSRV